MSAFSSVLAAFEARKIGGTFKAKCPAHDDNVASLAIAEGQDGRVLLKCHAGCSLEDVLSAAGLRLSDLFESSNGNQSSASSAPRRGREVCSYPYRDESGVHLYSTVRYEPKGFSQRRADGVPTLDGCRRVLYRLDDLIDAGLRVVVVEGEKDADTLWELGIPATSSVCGATHFTSKKALDAYGYGAQLRKAGFESVAVIPDNDAPGQAHSLQVRAACEAAGLDVRTVELPGLADKEDVSDYLDRHSVEELQTLIEEAFQAPAPKSGVTTDNSTPATSEIRRSTRLEFPEPDQVIFTGLAGELVEDLDRFTEASQIGVLAHVLVAIGSLIGRGEQAARVRVDGVKPHFLNLFVLAIGDTGSARKQTAWTLARTLCEPVDPHWRLSSGLMSGEGLVWELRDSTSVIRGKRIDVDEGVTDKRLLVVEEEFNRLLNVGRRDGCTLFDTLREAWDQDIIRTRGKHHPAVATNPHLSLIAHVQPQILQRRMTSDDFTSGFANRFLHIALRSSKVLANPPTLEPARLCYWTDRIKEAVRYGQECGELQRSAEAQVLWDDIYPRILRRMRCGLTADLAQRAASHVMRVAGLYAVLAGDRTISEAALRAGVAWWEYAEATLGWVYGLSLTGSDSADAIVRELRQAGEAGLCKSDMFGMRLARTASDLNRDLDRLAELGLASGQIEHPPRGGRGTERWTVTKEGAKIR